MIPTNICQSCGMPMAAIDHFGTNSDNSKSEDYCCFCFQKGQFTHSKTMEEVIEENLTYMDGSEKADGYALSREEARVKMKIDLPRLKRWRAHQTTHQEYYKAVNQVIDFINKNLHTPITLSDLASVAHISGFHFHRIFKAVMGESPGDYIQRLRLEKSAFKLQTTRLSITEIAEQTGYQSVQALGKAFKKRFKVTPTVFRKQPEEIKAPVYLVKKLSLSPKIKTILDKTVIYTRVHNPYQYADAYIKAWKKLLHFMKLNGIPGGLYEYLTLSHDISTITRPENCRIYACISCPEKIQADGIFGIQTIPGGLYAVFLHKGPYKELDTLYCNIYRNWITESNYHLRDTCFFEKYLNSLDVVPGEELLTEVYIPIDHG
ncbi:MAG: GyrI-like domain-containing protein [Tannerellaceae bacterium]|nr:GyrI-like domain-containing protein [Tannerellaceae bacterium]